MLYQSSSYSFLFKDPAPTEIYTLSLHDALPISIDRTGRCLIEQRRNMVCLRVTMTKITVVALVTAALFSGSRSEEHTSELQSHVNLVCRLLLEKKKKLIYNICKKNHQYKHISLT